MSWINCYVSNNQRVLIWKIYRLISSGGIHGWKVGTVDYEQGLCCTFGWIRKSPWQHTGEGHDWADGYPLTLFTRACQTDDATGVTRCPSWIKSQSEVFPQHLLCPSTSFSFLSCLILLSFPSFQFLLPKSQRSFGYFHRPGKGKSTAAKEKADISVSLKGLSRWLLQSVTTSCWQEDW